MKIIPFLLLLFVIIVILMSNDTVDVLLSVIRTSEKLLTLMNRKNRNQER